jgi:acetylornithine/succinyldiaminopimelate/putrescine aminotransferase
MIDSIISTNPLVQVSVSSGQKPYINGSALSSGSVRFNPSTQNLEVFDGGSNTWFPFVGSQAVVSLGHELEESVKWARKQMLKEQEWRKIAENNQAVKAALEQFEQARKNIELLAHLSKDHNDKDD